MEIAGTQLIPAARLAVWDALNDPAVLKRCLPGCESVERTSAEEFKVIVAAAIGPLRARFNGVLRMTEAQPPQSCVMVFEGQGGAVGFGQGAATVALREAEGGTTELAYTAKAQVGGKLAQVGSRLIDSVAKKMSDDFFKAFLKQFQAPEPATAAAEAPPLAAGAGKVPERAAATAETLTLAAAAGLPLPVIAAPTVAAPMVATPMVTTPTIAA